MKTRKEIKLIAKENFKKSYGLCLIISILIPVITMIISGAPFGAILAGLFVIGMNYFFIQAYKNDGELKAEMSFKDIFTGRKLGGYWWKQLFLFLWSLLFLIPGLIKSYSYSQTEYILADCPDVKAKDALKLSQRMMKGHKWQLFVFDLSFLGWILLSLLTAGLLAVFYVSPYVYVAKAGYYTELKEEALRSGVVTAEQLAGNAEI